VDALKSMSRLTLPNSLTLREYSMDMTMRPSSLVMSRSEAVMVVTSSTMARLVKALRSSETVAVWGSLPTTGRHRALDAHVLGDHRDQLEAHQQQGREHGADHQHTDQAEARLTFSRHDQWKLPMRFRSLKLNQMKKALPTMFSSGTKPQPRLS
jgi:hypothetical protein